MFFSAKNGTTTTAETQPDTPDMSWGWASIYVIGGLVGLILGGQWVVNGAVFIASSLGVSKALIGVTIVAIGTSLPELVTSAAAALKRNTDIAIGNVVGSNIFNTTWILGLSAVITPLRYDPSSNGDLFVTIGASIALFLGIFVGKKQILGKWQGGVFVAAYVAYIAISVIREIG
ncbi:MAG: sodium:calcium antiporter [Candidatus Paceibacteria bacterium]